MRPQPQLLFLIIAISTISGNLFASAKTTLPQGCKKWNVSIKAHLSYLNISDDGKKIFVSSSSDLQKSDKNSGSRMRLINGSGKTLWSYWTTKPIRSQAINDQGTQVAVTTYDNHFISLDQTGKKLWQKELFGKPVFFSSVNKILLFYDDDSASDALFSVFNYKGVELISKKSITKKDEPIDFNFDASVKSDKEPSIIISKKFGRYEIYNTSGDLIHAGVVKGELISGSLLNVAGTTTNVALLSKDKEKNEFIITLVQTNPEHQVKSAWTKSLPEKLQEIKISSNFIFTYSNANQKQTALGLSLDDGHELWKTQRPFASDYSAFIFNYPKSNLVFSSIDLGDLAGFLNIRAYSEKSTPIYDVAIEAKDGIFSYSFAETAKALVVGAGSIDDSEVYYYDLSRCK